MNPLSGQHVLRTLNATIFLGLLIVFKHKFVPKRFIVWSEPVFGPQIHVCNIPPKVTFRFESKTYDIFRFSFPEVYCHVFWVTMAPRLRVMVGFVGIVEIVEVARVVDK